MYVSGTQSGRFYMLNMNTHKGTRTHTHTHTHNDTQTKGHLARCPRTAPRHGAQGGTGTPQAGCVRTSTSPWVGAHEPRRPQRKLRSPEATSLSCRLAGDPASSPQTRHPPYYS